MKPLVALSLVLALLAPGSAPAYPIARERELGERFSIEAAGMLPLVREPEVLVFLDGVGDKIVSRLGSPQPFDYRFHVVRDPQLNAFAVPGGFLYFHSGLITRVGNDSELAGVVGHEIAHVHAHHIVRQQEKSQLASYGALVGMLLSVIQPALGAAAIGASATVQLKYQREFEQEADYMGLRFMREAGYDPHGMASFMKRILEEQRTQPLNVPPYMLSHPLTDERITHLEATTRDLAPLEGWERPSRGLARVQAILRALDGDRDETRRKYREAAVDAEGLSRLGLVLLHQGDFVGALEAFGKARAAGATLDADVGLAELRAGKIDDALRSLRAAVEAEPGNLVARANLGAALVQKGVFVEATQELERVIGAAPMLDEAAYNLGQAYGRSGDDGRGLYYLGRAFELRGDLERALSHYERAAKRLPEDSAEGLDARAREERLIQVLSERMLQQGRAPR